MVMMAAQPGMAPPPVPSGMPKPMAPGMGQKAGMGTPQPGMATPMPFRPGGPMPMGPGAVAGGGPPPMSGASPGIQPQMQIANALRNVQPDASPFASSPPGAARVGFQR